MHLLSLRMIIGLSLLLVITCLAIFAPLVAPLSPIATSVNVLGAPSAQNLLGTDQLGRDVLSRVIYGTRVSLQVGAFAPRLLRRRYV